MKKLIYISTFLFILSCGTNPSDKNSADAQIKSIDSTVNIVEDKSIEESQTEEFSSDNATYYVVVADTNSDYNFLRKKMLSINAQLKIPIDSMGRIFDKKKNLICLPENDEDELYAGEYYPRRYPSEHLSLEYLDFYQENAGDKTIALVRGIYENDRSASIALATLKKTDKKAFKIKSVIYVGCMH